MKKNTRNAEERARPRKDPRPPRAEQQIVFATYHERNGQAYVMANNSESPVVEIKKDIPLPIAENATVKVILRTERRDGRTKAIIIRVIGPELSLKERIARLLADAAIPIEFPPHVIAEAEKFGDAVDKSAEKDRRDLTGYALCTIDGETAKDFDDAVFATKVGKNIEVIVAIADVSHYVKVGSALDEEALSRGTSLYYPGHCVPMLPEALSNGLCSLKPNVKRLAIAVSFEVGPLGGMSKPRMEAAVIKSAARLTYNQVQAFYDDKTEDLPKISAAVQESLINLRTGAHMLRKARERRGAIDFDVVESVVALDDNGEPTSVHPQNRLDSHRIIEDLMVATNEVVAEFFTKKTIPSVYRVHEPPDQEKLGNFFKTASAFGVINEKSDTKGLDFTEPKAVQKLMSLYKNSRYQETLNTLMLRSMMQARYSEQNLMHFGLASKAYSHFTSPIRRYADLIVHRQLRFVHFENKPAKKMSQETLATIALAISQKEMRATEIERKIDRIYAATFMSAYVGKTFDALIVSVAEFGLFVRVVEHHVEGLVHIASISRSHVNFIPEKMSMVVSGSNERFMVGDKVTVKLINVNIDRGHVDFELVKPERAKDDRTANDDRSFERLDEVFQQNREREPSRELNIRGPSNRRPAGDRDHDRRPSSRGHNDRDQDRRPSSRGHGDRDQDRRPSSRGHGDRDQDRRPSSRRSGGDGYPSRAPSSRGHSDRDQDRAPSSRRSGGDGYPSRAPGSRKPPNSDRDQPRAPSSRGPASRDHGHDKKHDHNKKAPPKKRRR